MTLHGSKSELGGLGSRKGFAPRLKSELGGLGSRTGFAPRLTSELGAWGSRTGFVPRLPSELGALGSRSGFAPRLLSERVGRSSRLSSARNAHAAHTLQHTRQNTRAAHTFRGGQCAKQSNTKRVHKSVQMSICRFLTNVQGVTFHQN